MFFFHLIDSPSNPLLPGRRVNAAHVSYYEPLSNEGQLKSRIITSSGTLVAYETVEQLDELIAALKLPVTVSATISETSASTISPA